MADGAYRWQGNWPGPDAARVAEIDAAWDESRVEVFAESVRAAAVERIGHALAAHASCFRWRRGDVLLVDNARILHDGMPGLGPRRLWVAMWGARDGARQGGAR